MFEKLENRHRLVGEIVAETPIHVGSGVKETFGGTDLPILLTPDGKPYIPGSSFKGVVRSHAERLLRSIATTHIDGEEEPCKICSMIGEVFGTQKQASKVIFRDCPAQTSTKDYRFGIGIDRKTKTVAEGPFSFEFAPAGTKFLVEIVAENLSDVELGILCAGLNSLIEGHASIGGGKSRGLGAVKLNITKIEKISPIHYIHDDPKKGVEEIEWKTLKSESLDALRRELGV